MMYRGFTKHQDFSPSYDLAPPPPPRRFPSASCLSFSDFLCVASRAYWREISGEGGRGAKSYDDEKAWSSVNRSILSALTYYIYFYASESSWPAVRYMLIKRNSERSSVTLDNHLYIGIKNLKIQYIPNNVFYIYRLLRIMRRLIILKSTST